MTRKHYRLPLKLKSFFEDSNTQLSHCTLLESIDQNIELLLTTCPGEHGFNADFGCKIWDMDFERVLSRSQWEESFISHIEEAVKENEKRLTDVQVKIVMRDVQWEDGITQTTTIRKKVDVIILANIRETGQNCGFKYSLYMGPLSSD